VSRNPEFENGLKLKEFVLIPLPHILKLKMGVQRDQGV